MNILFEGINGSGKTTIIKQLIEELKNRGQSFYYISDLDSDTPLSPVLKQLFSASSFLEMKQDFKTSLFESLVLAAEHHYIQEKYRDKEGLIIYDRDFISVLSYQKDIIKKDYPKDWTIFYDAFRTIMQYQLKYFDLICYISIPIEDNIGRTEKRDNRKFSQDEKDMLVSLKNNMEKELYTYCEKTHTFLLDLDGRNSARHNCDIIINKILEF